MLNRLLVVTAVFTVTAGVWLGVMEIVLKHAGYHQRTLIATMIVIQGAATLLLPLLGDRPNFRAFVAMGATALALLGASAIQRILEAPHFEGFVLLIGIALVAQCVLTFAVVLRSHHMRLR